MTGKNAAVVQQEQIDANNSQFWNELCGTGLAKTLGIRDFSEYSLSIFDNWYFDFYPYLKKYLNAVPQYGSVLEIGLGYGTASGHLSQRAGTYYGLDIAAGPVEVVNLRLRQTGKPENAQQGSAHALPFADETLDAVVSIGCFHHTGSIEKCVNEAYRVLKSGGKLIFMCYNKRSYRMLKKFPLSVFLNMKDPIRLCSDGAALYDANSESKAAPFIEIGSKEYYKNICSKFSDVNCTIENWDMGDSRDERMKGRMVRLLGLDSYLVCTK
jgi:ubiquinone/menaquinone biosynthesis C-methylase UbiE